MYGLIFQGHRPTRIVSPLCSWVELIHLQQSNGDTLREFLRCVLQFTEWPFRVQGSAKNNLKIFIMLLIYNLYFCQINQTLISHTVKNTRPDCPKIHFAGNDRIDHFVMNATKRNTGKVCIEINTNFFHFSPCHLKTTQ